MQNNEKNYAYKGKAILRGSQPSLIDLSANEKDISCILLVIVCQLKMDLTVEEPSYQQQAPENERPASTKKRPVVTPSPPAANGKDLEFHS